MLMLELRALLSRARAEQQQAFPYTVLPYVVAEAKVWFGGPR